MEMRSFRSFVNLRGRGEGVRTHGKEKRYWEFRGVSFEEMEVRRAAAVVRGGKWVSKAWMLLLCVAVSALLCFWALIGSNSSSESRFFWFSSSEPGNEYNGQQLDEISLALLKLGLPLSAYAISMQNRAHLEASNASSMAEPNAFPGSAIVDQSSGSDRHPVKREGGKVQIIEEAGGSKWEPSPSELSIYSVASNYNYMQQLWVFQNVCYNGSHLIRLQNEVCREPGDAAPQSPLTPIHCKNGDLYARRLAMVKETGIPMAERLPSWVNARDSIVWRDETVSVVNLDSRTTDPGRFLQKVNMLLLLNNASTSAFVDQIDTFMFMAHHRVAKILKNRGADGENRFHKAYLSTILSRALPMEEKEVGDIFGSGRMADGRVQLNEPFSAATDDRPLCFRKAVLTGTLKGSCWPGGEVVADIVRDHLSERFDTNLIPRASSDWPYLVSVLGNKTRRMLSSASEQGFRALLDKKTMGLDVHIRDFVEKDFKEQFEILQLADIVLGFYGADLIVPSMFSRKMSILVEIIPYKVQDRAHETQALDSGLIYMAHQCEEGDLRDSDAIFQNQSASICMMNSKCKQHYVTVRKVELSSNDLSQIQKLLSLARLIASEMSAQKLATRRGRNIHDASSFLVENLIGGKGKCKLFILAELPSASCGTNWISFTSESQGPMTCCY